MDLVVEVSRMPHVGESLVGQGYSKIPGGKGANQAVGLARQGAVITLVGKVGRDAEGAKLLEVLKEEGIVTDFVFYAENTATGLAFILLDNMGQNAIVTYPGANLQLSQTELLRALTASSFDALMLQLEVPDEIIVASFQFAKKIGVPTFLDAGPARSFPLEQLSGIDVLSPNETEVLALTGIEVKSIADAELGAAELISRANAKAVVIKLGAAGALLRTAEGKSEHFPAHKVNVVDSTAAGDAFTAALMIRYLDTNDLRESVTYANLAGALTTTKLGAQPSLPTALEIEAARQQWQPGGRPHV
jgi:ribokinase